jgi:hypothetical protein
VNRRLRVGMGTSNRPTLQALFRCADELQRYVLIIPLDMQSNAELSSRIMDEKEYKRIRQDIEDAYRRQLEALDMVWAFEQHKNIAGVVGPAEPSSRLLPAQSMTALVREVLPKLGERFSIWEIQKEIDKMYPGAQFKTNSLSGTLTRMHQRKEILIVKKGEGTAPTIYKRNTSST